MDERIWLKHNETGGFFHCPADAVDAFEAVGWQPTEQRPAEPNAAVAERVAHEQQPPRQAGDRAKGQAREETRAKKRAAKTAEQAEDETNTDTPPGVSTEQEG